MKQAFLCALGLCFFSAAVATVESGCATGNSASTMGGGGVAGSGGATSGGSGGTGQGGQAGGGGEVTVGSGVGGGGTGGGGSGGYLAYAHTNKTLFEFDPSAANLSIKTVGDFDCIGGAGQDTAMTDLAVNQNGDVWGISETAVYSLQVQGTKVHCASKIPLNNANKVKFYALTFVPAGVLDPNKEVLVAGNTDGELWAVDEQGNLSLHGNFGNVPANDGNGHTYPSKNQGKRWELSGDIVFLANKGSPVGFATVRDCPSPPANTGCDGTDTLLEIDMTKLKTATTQSVTKSVRGQIVKKAGCSDAGNGSGYGSMYGIAAYEDKVFGFSHSGAIVEIDNKNGEACLILNQPSNYWDGAGVTTLAEVIDPEPK
jgi:hypothetical protein